MKHFRHRKFPRFFALCFHQKLHPHSRYHHHQRLFRHSDQSLRVPIRIKLSRVSAPVPPRATPIDSHSLAAKKGQSDTLMSSPSSSISCAWRIDVTVSSSQAKKVLRPTVLMTLGDKNKETFEMSLEMFQELRLTVAKMLTEMEWANEEVKRGGLGGR